MKRPPALRLPLQSPASSSARVRSVLDRAEQQAGHLPNMYAHMVNGPGVLESYLFAQDRFRKQSGFSPVEQEVVLLTISRENGCAYCIAAHSMVAERMAGVPREVLEAVRIGGFIEDPRLRVLSELTRMLLVSRGHIERRDVERFTGAGYSENQVLAILLAIAVQTLSNWSNHLCETELDDRFGHWALPEAAGAPRG